MKLNNFNDVEGAVRASTGFGRQMSMAEIQKELETNLPLLKLMETAREVDVSKCTEQAVCMLKGREVTV